jgi:hypothetical protein
LKGRELEPGTADDNITVEDLGYLLRLPENEDQTLLDANEAQAMIHVLLHAVQWMREQELLEQDPANYAKYQALKRSASDLLQMFVPSSADSLAS